jgi:hypothetical protein
VHTTCRSAQVAEEHARSGAFTLESAVVRSDPRGSFLRPCGRVRGHRVAFRVHRPSSCPCQRARPSRRDDSAGLKHGSTGEARVQQRTDLSVAVQPTSDPLQRHHPSNRPSAAWTLQQLRETTGFQTLDPSRRTRARRIASAARVICRTIKCHPLSDAGYYGLLEIWRAPLR